jgi:outer membrane lipoprotein-sorting protein
MMKKILSACGLLLACSFFPAQATADELTGRDIAVMVNEADSSKDMHRNAVMVIERGKQKLVRKMEMWAVHNGDERRSLIRFNAPADIQDSQFLSWTHDDVNREDDLWVFFPSENIVRRISGGGKKSAFMRSSFALEDIEYRSVDADSHEFLRNDSVNGRDVWVIESKAIESKSDETGYGRRVVFVDKEYRLPVKIEYYDTHNRLLKVMLAGDFRNIDGIWSAGKMIMQDEGKNSRTLMQYTDVVYNQGFDASVFDHNNLKR